MGGGIGGVDIITGECILWIKKTLLYLTLTS